MNEVCQCCKGTGFVEQKRGKIRFNGQFAQLFRLAITKAREKETVSYWIDRGNKEKGKGIRTIQRVILAKDFTDAVQYTIVAKLKYFGLLFQGDDWSQQGIYQVTDLAIAFARGFAKIPLEVVVANGKLIEKGDREISFKDALKEEFFELPDWISTWREGSDRQYDLF